MSIYNVFQLANLLVGFVFGGICGFGLAMAYTKSRVRALRKRMEAVEADFKRLRDSA